MYMYILTIVAWQIYYIRTMCFPLGQTKLICCCSDSLVVLLVKQVKYVYWVEGRLLSACAVLHAREIGNGSHFWARHSPVSSPADRLSYTPDQDSLHVFKHTCNIWGTLPAGGESCWPAVCTQGNTTADWSGYGGGTQVDLNTTAN